MSKKFVGECYKCGGVLIETGGKVINELPPIHPVECEDCGHKQNAYEKF